MRMLYISVHEPLHYDETSLFQELGIDVSIGSRTGAKFQSTLYRNAAAPPVAWDEASLRDYDCVVVMHNLDALKRVCAARAPGQRIIWRTIGQSSPALERAVRAYCHGIEIVRYSPWERKLGAWFAGETALIRFYKDPEEFSGWTGGGGVTMVASGFQRRAFPHHDLLAKSMWGTRYRLYGNNEGHPRSAGFLAPEALVPTLRKADVYVSAHSSPASYTLNLIEAMMVGAPVVTVSRRILCPPTGGTDDERLAARLYEVPDIIAHRKSGMLIRSARHGAAAIWHLLLSRSFREDLGAGGRVRAIELFGKQKIKEQWREFLAA